MGNGLELPGSGSLHLVKDLLCFFIIIVCMPDRGARLKFRPRLLTTARLFPVL